MIFLIVMAALGLIGVGLSFGIVLSKIPSGQRIRKPHGPFIDPNSKCPACGAENGDLKCVDVQDAEGKVTKMVRRTCRVCEAECYEPTILKTEKWVLSEMQTMKPRPS